jgi:DNA mismatch repair protein MutS
VIKRARSYLGVLESMQSANNDNPQGQLALTMSSADTQVDALREILDEVDPDTLSPRAALELVYRLKSS